MYLLWKEICQKGLKVAKYRAKVAFVTWELMAEAARQKINERMGNTGGCLWECRQFGILNLLQAVRTDLYAKMEILAWICDIYI